jgi:hypothetical protein
MNIQESTLVFKLGEDNNFSELNITSDIKHFIADLRGVTPEVANNIKDKFIIFGKNISNSNGSFIIVCEFAFDEDLVVVPTLQEAYDYIEMEEIERQLEA